MGKKKGMKVKDLMVRDVKTCGPWDDLAVATQSMEMQGYGCLPVVDGAGHAVGMLTDSDVCVAAAAQRAPLAALRVAGVMRKGVCSCDPKDTLATAREIMRARQIRRVPVVAADGRLAGLVSIGNLARKAGRRRKGTSGVTPEAIRQKLVAVWERSPARGIAS
jgi:CBS domain-containing protein